MIEALREQLEKKTSAAVPLRLLIEKYGTNRPAEQFATEHHLAWKTGPQGINPAILPDPVFEEHPDGDIPTGLSASMWQLVANRLPKNNGETIALTELFNGIVPDRIAASWVREKAVFDNDGHRYAFSTVTRNADPEKAGAFEEVTLKRLR
jgi:hypothetical protein